jgi:hypothetical protein
MSECAQCGGVVERSYRFCPWCATPQRRKLVEFFRPHPAIDPGRALRVSRYMGAGGDERHVRFSIWNDSGEAEAAVSLDDAEADRLARFIRAGRVTPPPSLAAGLRLGATKAAARLVELARR